MRYAKRTNFLRQGRRAQKAVTHMSSGDFIERDLLVFFLVIFVFDNVPRRILTIHGRLARMTNLVVSTRNKTGSGRFFIFDRY